jgi:hypothetical protein
VDLTAMGVAPDAAAAWLQAQAPELEDAGPDLATPAEVWPVNWPVLGLFLRLQTQWTKDAWGNREGLRYEAAEAAMRLMRMPDKAAMFDQLVEMEHAALEVLNA